MGITDEQAEALVDGFREFLDWFRAVNAPKLRETIESTLDSTAKRVAYQLTAPNRASATIADAVEEVADSVSGRTVRAWQKEWVRLGLVRQISPRKRERIFDLQSLGVDVGADLSDLDALDDE